LIAGKSGLYFGGWLQWADEVFVPEGPACEDLVVKREGDLLLLLSASRGACAALTEEEAKALAA
jgi:hypothetical protein